MVSEIKQFSTSALKEESVKAATSLMIIVAMIDEVASAPYVAAISPELKAIQEAANQAMESVKKLEAGVKRYEDLCIKRKQEVHYKPMVNPS